MIWKKWLPPQDFDILNSQNDSSNIISLYQILIIKTL
jgi:hypothetical protein